MIDAVMYGMIPSEKMANRVSAPPREQVEEGHHAACLAPAIDQLLDGGVVDARVGDVRAESVDRDDREREEDLAAKIGNLERVPKRSTATTYEHLCRAARCFDLLLRLLREPVRPHGERLGDVAVAPAP